MEIDERRAIAFVWDIDDIFNVRPDLTNIEARNVLASVEMGEYDYYGINSDTLEDAANDLFTEREEGALVPVGMVEEDGKEREAFYLETVKAWRVYRLVSNPDDYREDADKWLWQQLPGLYFETEEEARAYCALNNGGNK